MSDDDFETPKMGEVVSPDFGSDRLEIKQISHGGCRHSRVLVDPELRRVICKECDVTLDPIEVLLEYASFERRFQYRRETMNDMREKILELQAEEKRIKSRIKYAKKKAKKDG
jgi:hypothetical protein